MTRTGDTGDSRILVESEIGIIGKGLTFSARSLGDNARVCNGKDFRCEGLLLAGKGGDAVTAAIADVQAMSGVEQTKETICCLSKVSS